MKQVFLFFLVIVGAASVEAKSKLNRVDPTLTQAIDCPPHLWVWDKAVKDKYGVYIGIPYAEDSSAVSSVLARGNGFFNGLPLGLSGEFFVEPVAPVERVADVLKATYTNKQTSPKTTGQAVFKDGIVSCHYRADKDEFNDDVTIVITSRGLGRLYQCPLPEEITVIDEQDVAVDQLLSVPFCTTPAMRDERRCKQQRIKIEAGPADVDPSDTYMNLYHVTNEYGLPYPDRTDNAKRPLLFKITNESVYHAYQFQGKFGTLTLESPSVRNDLVAYKSRGVIDFKKISPLNRGVEIDDKHRAINKDGKLVVPPFSGMRLTMKGHDHPVSVECIYGPYKDPKKNIVLKTNVRNIIDFNKCQVWGGALGTSRYDVMELLKKSKPSGAKKNRYSVIIGAGKNGTSRDQMPLMLEVH